VAKCNEPVASSSDIEPSLSGGVGSRLKLSPRSYMACFLGRAIECFPRINKFKAFQVAFERLGLCCHSCYVLIDLVQPLQLSIQLRYDAFCQPHLDLEYAYHRKLHPPRLIPQTFGKGNLHQ
jgi:hypothetical protein